MKKRFGILMCVIFSQSFYAKHVVQMSIPKTGTHLLRKCICTFTKTRERDVFHAQPPAEVSYFYQVSPDQFGKTIQSKKHWLNHLFFDQNFEQYLSDEDIAYFFIYRDPRDQVVSFAHYMLNRDYWDKAKSLSFDDLLLAIIEDGPNIYDNHPPCKNIGDLYQRYIPWMNSPHVCVLRFEDLIGSRGGGNDEAQFEAVQKIATHLGLSFSDQEINDVANAVFGGTSTFRKGQIGSWKKHFKDHHKEAFKSVAGQLLIDLGYEDSFDW